MLAVSSLAMGQQDGKEKLDALQHYAQTLPELLTSLKSEEDLASDGAFLTHFLMLIYEVCQSLKRGCEDTSNAWNRLQLQMMSIPTCGPSTFERY